MKKIYLLLILLLTVVNLNAQDYKLKAYVFGASAYNIENNSFKILNTVAQPIVGEKNNQFNKIKSGFWYIYEHFNEEPTSVIDYSFSKKINSSNKTFSSIINPNPVDKEINLNIYSNNYIELELQVFDILGYKLLEDKIQAGKIHTNKIIDVQYFSRGTYFIVLKTLDDFAILRFVKN